MPHFLSAWTAVTRRPTSPTIVILNHDGGENQVNWGAIRGVEPLLVEAPGSEDFLHPLVLDKIVADG